MDDVFLKEGFVVWIDDPLKKFYTISRREAFDYETGDENSAYFSTVASGSTSGFKGIEILEPDNKPPHLFQVLWGVADTGKIKYYIKIPTGQNRIGVDEDKEIGFINADKSPHYDPNPMYQFYLINGWYPSIDCRNGSPVTITPKIWFRGMKYDIEELTNKTKLAALENGAATFKKVILGGIKMTP